MLSFLKKKYSKIGFKISQLTDVGLVRPRNEDAMISIKGDKLPYYFIAVADGMGGHEGGSVVSQYTVDNIKKYWNKCEEIAREKSFSREDLEKSIIDSLKNSNDWIYQIYNHLNLIKPMGTTFTGVLIDEEKFSAFHVGDSRLYVNNDNKTIQITKDHTWVQKQMDKGLLTQEQALNHPSRSVLTRCLGASPNLAVDVKRYFATRGTKYLVATDGLYGSLSTEEIHKLLSSNEDLNKSLKRVKKITLERGATDNFTGVLARF